MDCVDDGRHGRRSDARSAARTQRHRPLSVWSALSTVPPDRLGLACGHQSCAATTRPQAPAWGRKPVATGAQPVVWSKQQQPSPRQGGDMPSGAASPDAPQAPARSSMVQAPSPVATTRYGCRLTAPTLQSLGPTVREPHAQGPRQSSGVLRWSAGTRAAWPVGTVRSTGSPRRSSSRAAWQSPRPGSGAHARASVA